MAPDVLRLGLVLTLGVGSALACLDVAQHPGLIPECERGIQWAQETGIVSRPEWYTEYPFLTKASSLEDFQLALFVNTKDNIQGNGEDCVMPCNPSKVALEYVAAHYPDKVFGSGPPVQTSVPTSRATAVAISTASAAQMEVAAQRSEAILDSDLDLLKNELKVDAHFPVSPTSDSQGAVSSSAMLSVWVWLLMALGVCCCPFVVLACAALLCYESVAWLFGEEKRAQKKRAVTTKTKALPETTLQTVAQPVQTLAQPMQTFAPAPVRALPTMMTAMPMYAPVAYAPSQTTYQAAPSVSYAVPARAVEVRSPSVSYVAPVQPWVLAANAPNL